MYECLADRNAIPSAVFYLSPFVPLSTFVERGSKGVRSFLHNPNSYKISICRTLQNYYPYQEFCATKLEKNFI
jgi:hypothetical protein